MNGITNAPRSVTLALASGAVLIGVLSGCGPETVAANERGGVVTGLTEDSALPLANAHCHKFGRVAQVTGVNYDYTRLPILHSNEQRHELATRLSFACVAP
jgi:hypothetical protein